MENFLTTIAPQLGASAVFLAMAVYLFRFLMDMVMKFINYLTARNRYLEEENKELRQALFMSRDPDTMRLASALMRKPFPTTDTNIGEPT